LESDKEYKAKGFPLIAINPNDPALVPEDSYENMITVSKEKKFTYPYLIVGSNTKSFTSSFFIRNLDLVV